MEDMGDNGTGRGGKHNLNFEDHEVLFFCVTAKNKYSTVMV